ncbi:MAG: hypothetical protein ACI85S_002862, partial [Pseudohongiellaceae bacterium]
AMILLMSHWRTPSRWSRPANPDLGYAVFA